jgi:predicted nucleic acid-binding protein
LTLVLDSSAALSWVLEDERNAAMPALDALEFERAAVLQHWILEVTNALRLAVRRQRLKPDEPAAVLARLRSLPLHVDVETSARGWGETLALAERFELTTYDAAYLELALRLDLPLATLDQDLARAARAARVPLF